MINRRNSRKIKVGNIFIGGDSPIAVQSMTNTPTKDSQKTLKQILDFYKAGCELVRVGVPDMESARALGEIVKNSPIPVTADIHFDARLAQEAINQGVHKLRINPGNLRNKEEVKDLAYRCKEKNIPIRIGVNAGSLDPEIYKKYGKICSQALVESAKREVKLLEEAGFSDIIISLKASSVPLCVDSYRLIAKECRYPLHVGITEAGVGNSGIIKSSAGIGILLYEGIGDTLRVSLTDDPVIEVDAAWEILKALGIRKRGPYLVSCPTCARTQIDVITLAKKVQNKIKDIKYPIKVAVMGCVVNGPGEAKDADVGIAGGKGKGVIFREGKKIRTVLEEDMLEALMEEINNFINQEKYNEK